MPIYRYECVLCGHTWEETRGMAEGNPRCQDPDCGGPVEKVINFAGRINGNCGTRNG